MFIRGFLSPPVDPRPAGTTVQCLVLSYKADCETEPVERCGIQGLSGHFRKNRELDD